VAADVVACAGDHDQLAPLLDEAQAMTGCAAQVVVADTGYFSMIGISHAMAQKSDVYVPDRRATRKDAPAKNPYHKEHFVYDAASDTFTCPLGQSLPYLRSRATHWTDRTRLPVPHVPWLPGASQRSVYAEPGAAHHSVWA
jgi:hypothetical protein